MESFDFLGGPINFYTDNKPRIASKYGAVVTLITGFLMALLIIGFGRNFFNRSNPLVIRSVENPDDYKFLNFTNEDFTFAVRIEDYDGNPVDGIETSFFFTASYFLYEINSETGDWDPIVEEEEITPLVKCNESMFPKNISFLQNDLSSLYCPLYEGRQIGGYWDGTKIGWMFLRVFYCNEGYTNNNGDSCTTNEVKDKMIEDISYFSIYHQKVNINPLKYEDTMKKEIQNTYYQIDKRATKGLYLYYQNKTVITDFGWILETKVKESFIGLKDFHFDMYNVGFYDPSTYEGNIPVGELTIYYSKEDELIIREYIKIQTLAANVGGILKLFLFVGSTVIQAINNAKYMYECQSMIYRYTQGNIHPYLEKDLKTIKNHLFSFSEGKKRSAKLSSSSYKKPFTENVVEEKKFATQKLVLKQELSKTNLSLDDNYFNEVNTVNPNEESNYNVSSLNPQRSERVKLKNEPSTQRSNNDVSSFNSSTFRFRKESSITNTDNLVNSRKNNIKDFSLKEDSKNFNEDKVKDKDSSRKRSISGKIIDIKTNAENDKDKDKDKAQNRTNSLLKVKKDKVRFANEEKEEKELPTQFKDTNNLELRKSYETDIFSRPNRKVSCKVMTQRNLQHVKRLSTMLDPEKNLIAEEILDEVTKMEIKLKKEVTFYQITKFLFYKLSFGGKLFHSREQEEYKKIEKNYMQVLDFVDFINNKIIIRRLMAILLTKEQQKIITK